MFLARINIISKTFACHKCRQIGVFYEVANDVLKCGTKERGQKPKSRHMMFNCGDRLPLANDTFEGDKNINEL